MKRRLGTAAVITAISGVVFMGILSGVASPAQAQESSLKIDPNQNQNSVKLDDVQKDTAVVTAKPQDDLDKEITDPRLRAQSGSKNKYSSSLQTIYMGANLANPGGDVRPTLGNNRHVSPVSLSGNVGLRYRLDKNDSIFFSTGFNRPQPMQQSESSQPTQVSTPSVAWNDTFAWLTHQVSSEMKADFTTTRDQRQLGNIGSVGYSATIITPIGYTRFDYGLALKFQETIYNESDEYATQQMQIQQKESSISFSPSLQFRILDNFNVFSSLDAINYTHYRVHSETLYYENTDPTVTLGAGYAINRDMYLSPFIQFEPLGFSWDRTTYSIAARVNL